MITDRAPIFALQTPKDGRVHVVGRTGLRGRYRIWCDGGLAGEIDGACLQDGYCFSPWIGSSAPQLLELEAQGRDQSWSVPIWQDAPRMDPPQRRSLWRALSDGPSACLLGTPRELRRIAAFMRGPALGVAGVRRLHLIVLDSDGLWQPETLPDLPALTRIDHLHVSATGTNQAVQFLKTLLGQNPPAFVIPLGQHSATWADEISDPIVAVAPFVHTTNAACLRLDTGAEEGVIDGDGQALSLRFNRKDLEQVQTATTLLETWLGPWSRPPLPFSSPSLTPLADRALRLADGRPVVVLDDGQPLLDSVAQRFGALRFLSLCHWQVGRKRAERAIPAFLLSAIKDAVVLCPSPDVALEMSLFAWLRHACAGYISHYRAYLAE